MKKHPPIRRYITKLGVTLSAFILFPYFDYGQNEGLIHRIDSLHQAGNYQLATSAIEEALSDSAYSQKTRIWVLKGKVYHDRSKTTPVTHFSQKIDYLKTAYSAYTKAIELDTSSASTNEAFFNVLTIEDQIYKLAMDEMEKENYPGTYQAFRFLVDSRKKSPALSRQKIEQEILFLLGQTAALTGRMEEAEELYLTLKENGYRDIRLYQELAELYKNKERYQQAVAILGDGFEQHPQSPRLLFDQSAILMNQHQHEKAAQKLEAAVGKLDTSRAELHFRLGIIYDELKNYKDAGHHYSKATEIKPDYYRAHYNKGVMYYNRAIEMNKKLKDMEGFSKKYGETMEKRDSYLSKARPHFEKALNLKPDHANLDKILSNINETLE